MSVTKALFDLILREHPELEVKYSKLNKLKESEWQYLFRMDQRFHQIRQSLKMEKLSRKDQMNRVRTK